MHWIQCPLGQACLISLQSSQLLNPAYLKEETPEENNSRKGSPGEIYYSVHEHAIVDLCTHRPHCIRAPREDVRCSCHYGADVLAQDP
jgi:hypothetical protein